MKYLTPSSYGPTNFTSGRLYRIHLAPYIERFCKARWRERVSEKGYKVYLATGSDYRGYARNGYRIAYRDGKYNFLLHRVTRVNATRRTRRRQIACIGFDVNTEIENCVVVKQIQGVRGEQTALRPLRWEKMLLQIVVDWARGNGFAAVRIEFYEGQRRKEEMYLRYKMTAERLGFKLDANRKASVLTLS